MRSRERSADGPRPAEPQSLRAAGNLLSPGERALWFLHRLAPGSAAYNLAGAIRIENLDPAALRRSVHRLVERHPALRTTFPAEHGEPARRVLGWLEPEIVEEDASGLACDGLRERLETEALRPFEPERGPLLRLRMFLGGACGGAALFVFHHLVADFWSLTVILRELGELYGEETGGGASRLTLPPASYEQWVERQELGLAGARGEALRELWTGRLSGPVPVLDLPADRPRPAQPSGAGVGAAGRLGAAATERLQGLCRESGATLFAVLLAGFQLLLHRVTGDEEIWIGVPSAGRGPARWARTVGYFVNPVVLRGRPGEALSFAQLVDRARGETEEALAHRDWPFPWLAEALHPVRDAGRTPLFQAMLVLYRTRHPEEEPLALLALGEGGGKARLGDLSFETLPLARRGAQLDISLTAAVVAGELRLRLDLDADRFDAATAERLVGRLEALLEAAAERPEAPVDDLPLFREAERQALFVEWNDPRPVPVHGSLDALVAAQAERTPQATALVCRETSGERRLTYGELIGQADTLAERLARRLKALGAGPEVRVAICAGRSPELVAGILAILRAGAAYVPLDPAHPSERLAWVLEDSGASLLLTESSRLPLFAESLAERAIPTLLFDAHEEAAPVPDPAGRPESQEWGPGRLAYILYTSGSTGRPKGVALEHAGALALLRWADPVFSDADLAGVLASTSIGFDLSVFELFLPLSRGGTVLLVPDALHAGTATGVTLINTVPSAMTELVRLGAVPPTVRVVCLAGERLPGSLAAAVHRAAPGTRVLNLYGPTEATTYSTWFEVGPGLHREPAIGWPVAGTRAHLLDHRLRLQPVGVVGELFLAGAGLARGYVGRPDLTAERFLPDPWSPEPGGRLYSTGDLARRRPDGVLELLGRRDQQVKIRGFRIELGEVEAALTSHPAVREAAVEVREEVSDSLLAGDRRLVAWVVGEGGEPDPMALRDHLTGLLPGPMVPSVIVPLDALPLTRNGKVDRRALASRPLPDEGRNGAAGYVPPRNSIEESLCAVWAEVLGRERVGIHDDFFLLGGHSLLATRVLARIGELFQADLPLRDLFEATTPAALAERLRNTSRGRTAPPIRHGAPGETIVLSFAQERFWFLHRLEPDTPAYNVAGAVRVRGPLRIAALERTLGEIVRRHQVLRTRFPEVDGAPRAVVDPPLPLPLPQVDLAALPADRREPMAERLAAETAASSFDLADGPLLRAMLIRLGAEEYDLLASVHHIAADGASIDLFFRELAALYREPGAVPDPPVQYADYARWQRAWLTGEVLEARLSWWEKELAGAPTALDLPTDRPRSAASTSRGGLRSLALAPGLADRLDELRQRLRGTRFMSFAAVFQTLLGRLSGQGDVLIGTPVSERSRRELEPLIGCLINTLVLRGRMADDPIFEDQLRRIRTTSLAMWAHQDLPFERLVERLPGARDAGRTPLFQALLTTQTEREGALELGDAAVTLRELDSGAAKLDLSLTIEASGSALRAILRYRRDLFDASTAQRFLEHFESLLASGLEDPSRRLSELPLLGAAQRHQVLLEWGEGEAERPEELPVHELIRQWAAMTPDAPAVLFEGRTALTWRDLTLRSCRLARSLRQQGAGPGTVVGISLDRSPDLVVAVLGTLETGAAYLPLDPAYPVDYLAHVVEDSGVSIILSKDAPLPTPAPDEEMRRPCGEPPPPLDSWAYVLYTSGSTGKPKGTPVTHRALLNYLTWALDEPLAGTGGILFLTSLNFDASLKQLFAPLLQGKPVRLLSDETARRPERLLEHLLEPERAGERLALNCVPSVWRALLDHLEAPAVPHLFRLLLGGEGFDRDLLDRTFRLMPELEVWNLYGPTEATANAGAARLVADDRAALGIGRPVRGANLYVLDPFFHPLPPGTAGELVIGGTGVAPGYWRRPELTAERFVPDPFVLDAAGARLFRTGDLARWRADGSLELLGRIDRQLKIRGLRIEPGEVETALLGHPSVAECVVGIDPAAARLVAWVVPRAGSALLATELRRYLEALLPAALVPAAFVILGALPLLPNGKVSRASLPPPDSPVPRASAAAPRTPAEEMLAWLWCEVLGVPEIGVHDDFFERGGHSLLAARLLARVRSIFGVDLPLRTLFAAPTIARLAQAIVAARRERRNDPVPVEPVPRDGNLPLSFAQERLWFIDQWIPESPAYNIPAAVLLRGPLDVAALGAALAAIVRRHETLRTTFAAVEGNPVQIIHPGMTVPLPVVDLEALGLEALGEGGEAGWRALAGEEARRGFDLWSGPLLRTSLLRLGAADHVLVVNLHHIISDGWSMGVLIEELRALYVAFHEGRPPQLAPLPVQYVDYAVWQRRLAERKTLAGDLDWWRGLLADAPAALELPADRPRPLWSIHRGAVEKAALPAELTGRLRELARQGDVTLFMILLAAFELLLARLAGVEDLVVGTALAQRTPEVEGLIGLFVNLLALRGDLSGDPSFVELLARTRRATLEAHDHRDVPFEKLVAALEPVRDPGRHPVFQVAFTLQNAPMPEPLLPGLDLEIEQLDSGTARFDLTLLLHEVDGGLAGALERSADLFDAATVRRLLSSFESLLRGIADDPRRPISRLPLVSDAERRQILEVWSRAADQMSRPLCIHEQFALQAAHTPDAVALVEGANETTYRELARRSALLARRLRAAGAGPDVPVAVLLERSADMVVALLGILRAGAGYVPLDLAYPRERLAWMLEDSGARIVVSRDAALPDLASQGLTAVAIGEAADLPADPAARLAAEEPVSWTASIAQAHPDNLAYIVYTSGSTGKPKGVAATHRGVLRVVVDPGYATLGADDTILQLAPVPFDASTFEIWGALLNGGRLAVYPPGPVSLRELAAALRFHRVTTLFLTTGLFHQMIDEEPAGLAGLRQLITGGDVISVARVRRALELLPGCQLIHAYGPTETTTFATCHPVAAADVERPTLTLGRPIPRTTVWLLDERGEPAPPGVPGELLIGGDGLARGYWRHPVLTANRFVPHPFAARPGERLYRTGDLARWLPDGTVDFLGRIDRQVKIRGFRVEPAEIEATLERHPGIAAAVVQPRDDGRGNKRLVAWLVPSGEEAPELSDADLLAWCRERLPAFMVPGAFVVLDALPLDPNGKVDRKALPEPDRGSRAFHGGVAPRTPVEQKVAAVWSEVLGVEQVGAEDDFFELGGHSLLATQIVSRLSRELGVDLGLRAFFDEPTVAGVALAITREQVQREDPDRMARLLARVQDLSPEELAELLREEGA
jgi:amino acid adenylation domain-containing protein